MTSSTAGSSTPKRSAPMRKTRNRAMPSRNMGNHVDELRDDGADVLQRGDTVRPGALDGRLRHSEDRSRLAVLDEGEPTGLANDSCPLSPIAAHPREHDGDRGRAEQ